MADIRTLPDKILDEIAVKIGDQQYFIKNPDAICGLDHLFIGKAQLRIGILINQDSNTADERAEAARLIDRFCRIILDAPDEVHDKFTETERLKLIDFFLLRRQQTPKPQQQTTQEPGMRQHRQNRAGRKSSRG